ncbi:ribbon-helix-helix domain-containing protein [Fischerella sp. JS2]|uniref:ribbon-helix-helix domain-containing protein n=1 Tax=Fischerella sp. JS2 TaxID=2597771 RepID=UPI0037C11AAE
MSKRFTVTLPDSVFEDLEVLADIQGRPTANLAAFLIEIGIRQAKESGEFPEKPKTSKTKKAKEDI